MTTDERLTIPEPPKVDEPLVPPAKITLLYESRDGRFCLFEDAEGHLTSVDSLRFA